MFSQQERTRWPLIFICPDLLFSLFEPLHQADKTERQRWVFNVATAIHLGIYLELERKESCSLQRCVRSCRLARAVVNSSVYCLHRSNSGWTCPLLENVLSLTKQKKKKKYSQSPLLICWNFPSFMCIISDWCEIESEYIPDVVFVIFCEFASGLVCEKERRTSRKKNARVSRKLLSPNQSSFLSLSTPVALYLSFLSLPPFSLSFSS